MPLAIHWCVLRFDLPSTMSWFRRSKLALHTFRTNFSSKITPKPSISPQPCPKITGHNHQFPPVFNCTRAYGSSPFSRNLLGFQSRQNPFTATISRRCYYVDYRRIRHFKPRGFSGWYKNRRTVFIVVVVGSGILLTIYLGNSETIPYTKRTHYIILSKSVERQLGESQFEEMKKQFKGKILPAIHPDSLKVRLIATEIIQALQRGLKKEQVWTDPGYASEPIGGNDGGSKGLETLEALSATPEGGGGWSHKDEILDDKWVQQSRKKSQEKGTHSSTGHLEGVKWEVLVVDEPVVNAFCLPGGKIVVFTGLLKHFRTDAEIATIIGHEVGHAVARHSAEQITKNLLFTIIQLVLYQFVAPDVVNTMSNYLLKLPFSRRMELEADYIGLLLMASAGYDPRVAPGVFQKLGQVAGDSALRDYLSTHPSGKKRAKLLGEAKVMEEALVIYRECVGGREVEGFFL